MKFNNNDLSFLSSFKVLNNCQVTSPLFAHAFIQEAFLECPQYPHLKSDGYLHLTKVGPRLSVVSIRPFLSGGQSLCF
jgi:hypothetical protein